MVQKVVGSIPISHPISLQLASVVQRLVYKFSKLGMRVRLPPLAPEKVKISTCAYFLVSLECSRERFYISLVFYAQSWYNNDKLGGKHHERNN